MWNTDLNTKTKSEMKWLIKQAKQSINFSYVQSTYRFSKKTKQGAN